MLLVPTMGPQSEGQPPGDSRMFRSPPTTDDGGRHQTDREIDSTPHGQMHSNEEHFGMELRGPASPSVSIHSRDKEEPPKASEERERSRTRANRKGSAQLRLCKKCGEPLTGQFVRALGGTFHLDCFKCKVGMIRSLSIVRS